MFASVFYSCSVLAFPVLLVGTLVKAAVFMHKVRQALMQCVAEAELSERSVRMKKPAGCGGFDEGKWA